MMLIFLLIHLVRNLWWLLDVSMEPYIVPAMQKKNHRLRHADKARYARQEEFH